MLHWKKNLFPDQCYVKNTWVIGWEYGNTGKCEKMPSTRQVNATLQTLPCIEQDGMVWIWPGSSIPAATLPALLPPANYTIHAQVCSKIFDHMLPTRKKTSFPLVCEKE
jgi:hypothetical protein